MKYTDIRTLKLDLRLIIGYYTGKISENKFKYEITELSKRYLYEEL